MTTRLIILNGGSSSGKSSIVRCLQDLSPDPWLAFGADSFVDALPGWMRDGGTSAGFGVGADGAVSVGSAFHTLETAWRTGVAATVRAGARVVIDDIFLGAAASQQRWLQALDGLDTLWVGVRCAAETATARERARGDRTPGMAALQADSVHTDVRYDLEVDTTGTRPDTCAREIAARLGPADSRP